jgi:hypothetical protein
MTAPQVRRRTRRPDTPALQQRRLRACAVLSLPGQSAAARAAQEHRVREALGIMDDQMDQFVEVRKQEAHKAEEKWLRDFMKVYAARPPWLELDAPQLHRQVQVYERDFKRRSVKKGLTHRLQSSAERKRLAASMAYYLMQKYGLKLTGHRQGKFCRLAGILYNGDPRANCYSYCCELLQKKKEKALHKKKAAR